MDKFVKKFEYFGGKSNNNSGETRNLRFAAVAKMVSRKSHCYTITFINLSFTTINLRITFPSTRGRIAS